MPDLKVAAHGEVIRLNHSVDTKLPTATGGEAGVWTDLKNVDERGALDAAYLNPRPIHVAKAEAFRDGAATKVFIELRDVNYPGSSYELTYDPQSDQLTGIYFQAVQQQRFEVVFDREK